MSLIVEQQYNDRPTDNLGCAWRTRPSNSRIPVFLCVGPNRIYQKNREDYPTVGQTQLSLVPIKGCIWLEMQHRHFQIDQKRRYGKANAPWETNMNEVATWAILTVVARTVNSTSYITPSFTHLLIPCSTIHLR